MSQAWLHSFVLSLCLCYRVNHAGLTHTIKLNKHASVCPDIHVLSICFMSWALCPTVCMSRKACNLFDISVSFLLQLFLDVHVHVNIFNSILLYRRNVFKKQISNHMSVSVIYIAIYKYIIVDKKDMTACMYVLFNLGVWFSWLENKCYEVGMDLNQFGTLFALFSWGVLF